jgi:hypothetical protein
MITIRLSDREYREIRSRCGSIGDVSVSGFVRAAITQALGSSEVSASSTGLQLAAIHGRLDRLDQKVGLLAEQVGFSFS